VIAWPLENIFSHIRWKTKCAANLVQVQGTHFMVSHKKRC